jgi:hypothetical protein
LTGVRLEAPYVLVGHPFGGVNVILFANTSNHTIHRDEPQLVVDAILKLVNAARSK